MRVLIDGLNLRLAYETGIKRYGKTLLAALKRLGANVSLLEEGHYGAKDRVLAETLRFDANDHGRGRGGGWRLASPLLQATTGFYKARPVQAAGVVVPRPQDSWMADLAGAFVAPDCYRVAHLLSATLSMTTRVWIPSEVDVLHLTCPLPIRVRSRRRPTLISTIHDLIPLRLPYATLDRKRAYYEVVKNLVRQSSVITVVSEATKRDLLHIFDADPNRIHVTYEPVDLPPGPPDKSALESVLSAYALRPESYLLFVGTIEPKKNVARLIRSYAMLATSIPLVIVGREGWLCDDVFRALMDLRDDVRGRIRWLQDVPNTTLSYLYAGAYCFVFPSLYEGFGLPALEAMAHGCPVIASRTAAVREVCGNAAAYVDPYDILDIRARLDEVLSDRLLRDTLAAKGSQHVKQFSMENYLPRLYRAYTAAVAEQ
jgi:glycosyltransferase involved in cell wall biosynthesis